MKRQRIDDFSDLLQAATRAIAKALSDGNEAHPPGSWATESMGNQMRHMEQHLRAFIDGHSDEDHLAHLICRAVIARRLQEWEREN